MNSFRPRTLFRFLTASLRRPQAAAAFPKKPGGRRNRAARVDLTLEALEDRTLLSGVGGALGVAGDFNVFVFGRLTQSYTDSEGRVAAGGDVSLTGYGVGSGLANSAGQRDDLVVGGNLTYNQGQVFNGNIVYGGTAALQNVGLPNGTARQGAPLDFAAAQSQLDALSAAFAALAANGTTADSYGTLRLTGADPTLDVFGVSGSQLATANGLNISAPAGAAVMVNVSGTADQMQYFGMTVSGTDKQHVVFNFPDATALTLAGISAQGSVLAPHADVSFSNGNLEGTLVARSLAGNGEFHNFPSQAQIPVNSPAPSGLSGTVYADANNDGVRQTYETALAGVVVTLTGQDASGHAVSQTMTTGADGSYHFTGLTAGTYTLTAAAPAGYVTGKATAGSQGGAATPGQIHLTLAAGVQGVNNNFGELLPSGGPVTRGQTATIGFWQGPNGQALINSFGKTANGLTLAGWLAATLPNLYGRGGMHDLTGRSDADVAALFRTLFAVHGAKVEAQILAAALAVFTTTNALDAGATSRALAAKDGFVLSDAGTGAALWNVGANNAAFGAAPNASLSVMDLLRRTDARVAGGRLFGGNAAWIDQANTVFDGINQAGDI